MQILWSNLYKKSSTGIMVTVQSGCHFIQTDIMTSLEALRLLSTIVQKVRLPDSIIDKALASVGAFSFCHIKPKLKIYV